MTLRCWSIRIAIATAVSVAAPLAGAAASCDALEPCAAKACRLDAEIAQAKAKGKTRQLAALERARAEMVHCNDDGLKQKRKVALEQAQRRIDRREAELKKAEASGDAAKVKRAQRNLESARKAYAQLEKSPL
jgi:multidrug efflux pump subunit AcrA (membrane-fusion protein)